MASTIDDDLVVRGTLRVNAFAIPANSVGNTQFSAADPLAAAKQEHQYVLHFTQPHGTIATSARYPIHVAHADGELVSFAGGVVVACAGAATITADLKKNGTTVLSSTVSIDNTNTAYLVEEATFSSTAYSANDVFEVVVTATAGGGTLGQGLFLKLVVREAAD